MSLAETMLAEFEGQAPVTRRFLERLPEDKLTWKPHEKSMSAGQLALHIARVPGGVVRFVQQSPQQAPDFASFPAPANLPEVLRTYDESVAAVRSVLPQYDDAKSAVSSGHHAESLVSASRPVRGVLAAAERSGSGELGAQRR